MPIDYKTLQRDAQLFTETIDRMNLSQEKFLANLEKTRQELKKQEKIASDIFEKLQLEQNIQKNNLDIAKAISVEKQKELDEQEKIIKSLESQQQKLLNQIQNLENLNNLGTITRREQIKLNELKNEEAKISNDITQKRIFDLPRFKQQVQYSNDLLELYKDTYFYQQKLNESGKEMAQWGQSVFQKMTGITQSSSKFLSLTKDINGNFQKLTFAVKTFVGGMSSMITTTNVLKRVKDITSSLVFELETQAAQTAALTSRNRQYMDELYSASVLSREYAITLTNISESFRTLYTEMSIFTDISEKGRQQITLFASQMSVLGVSLSTTAKNLNNLTIGLRMSENASQRVLLEIHSLAKNIGLDVRRIQSDFLSTFSDLAAFGDKSTEVFKSMAAASKSTGVTIGRLNSLFGDTMNTFEGSAEVAGKFNSIMGKDLLNSVDLLFAKNPADRILMVKKAFDATGKEWNKLGFFEKKAIAAAAGIKDMAEASNIFNKSTQAFVEMQEKAKLAKSEQDKFNESIKASRTFMERLNVAWQNLAVAVQPIVVTLGGIVNIFAEMFGWLNRVTENMNPFIKSLLRTIPVVLLLAAPLIVLSSKIALIVGAVTLLSGAIGGLWKWFTKKGSPAFWEMPKVMSIHYKMMSTSVDELTPKVKSFSQQSEILHKVQTKKGSPALWEINNVMSDGIKKQTSELKSATPEMTKMVNISKQFSENIGGNNTNNTVNTNSSVSNSTMISQNVEISRKLGELVEILSNKTKRKNKDIKVDVNFLDPDKTAREFKEAVLGVFEEVYG